MDGDWSAGGGLRESESDLSFDLLGGRERRGVGDGGLSGVVLTT